MSKEEEEYYYWRNKAREEEEIFYQNKKIASFLHQNAKSWHFILCYSAQNTRPGLRGAGAGASPLR